MKRINFWYNFCSRWNSTALSFKVECNFAHFFYFNNLKNQRYVKFWTIFTCYLAISLKGLKEICLKKPWKSIYIYWYIYMYNTGKNKLFSQLVSTVAIVKGYTKLYECNYHIFSRLQQYLRCLVYSCIMIKYLLVKYRKIYILPTRTFT